MNYDIQDLAVYPTGEQIGVLLPGLRITAKVYPSGSQVPIADFSTPSTMLTLSAFFASITSDDLAEIVMQLAPIYFSRVVQPPA